MEAAEHDSAMHKQWLSEEIDELRRRMSDMFMRELSLTADRVMEISRQLDVKINEYMKQSARTS